MNNDGTISVADLLGVQGIEYNEAGLLFCGDPLPYTGSICDYPWLLNTDGTPNLHYIETFYNFAKFDAESAWFGFEVFVALDSDAYGTWMFPDMNGDGMITEIDYITLVNGMFFMGESTVDCTVTPPGITKPSVRERAIHAKAIRYLAENSKKPPKFPKK